MSLEPTVLEGFDELIIGAERGDVRAAVVVPDRDLDPDDVDRALDRLRAVATYELEGRRLVADGGFETPDYWGRCDSCGDPLDEVGRITVASTPAGTLRFRFCSADCKDRFDRREVHREHDRGELVTDGGQELAHCDRCGDFLPRDQQDGELCFKCELATEEPTVLEVYPSDILLLLKLATIGYVVVDALDDADEYETVPLDRPLEDAHLLLVDYARELNAGEHWGEDDLDPLAEALEAEGLI